jgi:hypothetical protein
MKKSLIATGIFASSVINANANLTSHKNKQGYATAAYQWEVETEFDVFSGTCVSIDEVNKEISMLTENKKIFKKNIIPMTIDNTQNESTKIYTWDVVTKSDQANGVSASFAEAKKMIESFGEKGIIKSSIIESITKEN